MIHPQDKVKAHTYVRDMLSGNNSNDSVSPIYRLRVSHTADKYVHVQTKAKFFKCTSEPDFVMATHSIIADSDVANAEANSPHTCAGHSSSSGSVGGPLMPSVNGTRTILSSETNNQMTLSSTSYSGYSSSSDLYNDFGMDFPSSTLGELGLMPAEERMQWERPESRHSTPTPSPHTSFAPTQPSPYQASITFPFSPMEHSPLDDTKDKGSGSVENGSGEGDSARLRKLLMDNKRPSIDSDEGGGGSVNKNRVLKGLLGADDDEDKNQPPSSDPPTPKVSSGNNMLLKVIFIAF